MIKADQLYKQFRKNINAEDSTKKKSLFKKEKVIDFMAVNGVSLEAREGEILGILGPNGAGKTTLLRMLGLLMEPTDGTVTITDKNGELITNLHEKKKAIGYLSGNTKLYHRFSIRETMTTMGDIYGIPGDILKQRVEEIIDILGMQDFADNRIERLSTGQTQRASIARCLVHSPDIYIFDEPTLGLDIISSQSIIEFMKQEKEAGKTILYSTHYMEEAQYLCDRIVMMHMGQIIEQGTPEEIMNRTKSSNLRDAFTSIITSFDEKKGGEVIYE